MVRVTDGSTVMIVVPLPVTCQELTAILSIVELSETFLMRILPVHIVTFSENVMTRFEDVLISVALSDGESVTRVGDESVKK